jgi:hypothetical protein|tara:strand:- start:3909 stop:4625 length:717 start_codon:yes stop_codon:yes gene_type:complete
MLLKSKVYLLVFCFALLSGCGSDYSEVISKKFNAEFKVKLESLGIKEIVICQGAVPNFFGEKHFNILIDESHCVVQKLGIIVGDEYETAIEVRVSEGAYDVLAAIDIDYSNGKFSVFLPENVRSKYSPNEVFSFLAEVINPYLKRKQVMKNLKLKWKDDLCCNGDTEENIESDILTINTALGFYFKLNGSSTCPDVNTLLDDGFINPNDEGYDILKQDSSMYKIVKDSQGVCHAQIVQ